jgi:hypothetical protein
MARKRAEKSKESDYQKVSGAKKGCLGGDNLFFIVILLSRSLGEIR